MVPERALERAASRGLILLIALAITGIAGDARAANESAGASACEAPAQAPRQPGDLVSVEADAETFREIRAAAEATGDERRALKAWANELRKRAEAQVPTELGERRADGTESIQDRDAPEADGSDRILHREIERAAHRSEKLGVDEDSLRLLIHLGRSARILGSHAAAPSVAAAAEALAAELWLGAVDASKSLGDPGQQALALGYLAELYRDRGRVGEALVLVDRALFAAQQADALETSARWLSLRAELLLAAGRRDEALEGFRAAVASFDRLRAETGSRFVLDFADQSVYRSLVDLLLRAAAENADPEKNQRLLAEARTAVERQKAAELRDYFSDPCLATKEGIASDDVPGALVVYPVVLPDRLELIVSGHGRIERFKADVGQKELDQEVANFRRTLQRRTSRQYLRHARKLYTWLVEPIESLLESVAPATLVYVPGGSLRTIPIAALQRESDKSFLIERFPVAVIPSLALTEPRAIDRGQVRLLAAGLAVGVQGFPALTHVTGELDLLSDRFDSTAIRDADFLTARVSREVKNVPYGIIHIASHGEFNGDPEDSFLLTHDGRLSMNDLSSLISATQFRADTPLELLTLSACQTALGDERAALGLAGIAVQAGASSVLATLWSINDAATARVIDRFYANLGSEGITRARALQLAQQSLLDTPEYRHPAYWAPFLLLNNWL